MVVFTEMPEKCVQASNTGNYLLPRTPDLHTVSPELRRILKISRRREVQEPGVGSVANVENLI